MSFSYNNELISVREAAKQCSKNPETIRRWIWSGKLPAEKIGNQLFIKRTNLAALYHQTAVHETAVVEYKAEPESGFLEKAMELREQMKKPDIKPLDSGELINTMRDETMKKKNATRSIEEIKEFLKRTKMFRDRIRERGLVFDSVELVKEAREGQ